MEAGLEALFAGSGRMGRRVRGLSGGLPAAGGLSLSGRCGPHRMGAGAGLPCCRCAARRSGATGDRRAGAGADDAAPVGPCAAPRPSCGRLRTTMPAMNDTNGSGQTAKSTDGQRNSQVRLSPDSSLLSCGISPCLCMESRAAMILRGHGCAADVKMMAISDATTCEISVT